MKQCFILLALFVTLQGISQALNFKTDIATAKSSYSSGKLEDAHFALQQSMQEIDIIIGKEVLICLHLKWIQCQLL